MTHVLNAAMAVIDERKVTAYLLSDSHPAGRAKAAFFRQLGFRVASRKTLRDALLIHLRTGEVTSEFVTEFGKKYIVEGSLVSPDSRVSRIRAVWFLATGDIALRLVTAYPVHGGEE